MKIVHGSDSHMVCQKWTDPDLADTMRVDTRKRSNSCMVWTAVWDVHHCPLLSLAIWHITICAKWASAEPNLHSGGQHWSPLCKFPESGAERYERAEPNLHSGGQHWSPLAKYPERRRFSRRPSAERLNGFSGDTHGYIYIYI